MTSLTSFLRGFATVLSRCARSWPGNVGFIGAQSEWPDAKDAVAALESAVGLSTVFMRSLWILESSSIGTFVFLNSVRYQYRLLPCFGLIVPVA